MISRKKKLSRFTDIKFQKHKLSRKWPKKKLSGDKPFIWWRCFWYEILEIWNFNSI